MDNSWLLSLKVEDQDLNFVVEAGARVEVGGARTADLTIPHFSVFGQQVTVCEVDGACVVTDIVCPKGLLFNGVRAHNKEMRLHEGDRLQLSPEVSIELIARGHVLYDTMTTLPWTSQEVTGLGLSLAKELQRLHDNGEAHGHITPATVFIDVDSNAHLIWVEDLPLASGVLTCNPRYLSPRLLRGEVTDAEPMDDLFALGCLLYQLLTNQYPWPDDSPMILITHTVTKPPRPVAETGVLLPARLAALVDSLIAVETGDPPEADEVIRRLSGL
jgi:serine/threonine protein kinase